MTKNYLCNFGSEGAYRKLQLYQRKLLKPYYEEIFEYNEEFLILMNFVNRNQYIFEHSDNGFGFCCWKPFIILDALNKIEYGDILTYLDTGDLVYNSEFFNWLEWNVKEKLNSRFFDITHYTHGEWTTMDCFIGMGCNDFDYHNAKQLEAGTLAFQKTDENINFLHEWLSWCCMPEIICKNMNYYGKPNLPGFKAHRGDQSILTNLFYKYNFSGEYMQNIQKYIMWNYLDDNYTRIINPHLAVSLPKE
jgi:hypothetical protein